jgi:hypothetical protein
MIEKSRFGRCAAVLPVGKPTKIGQAPRDKFRTHFLLIINEFFGCKVPRHLGDKYGKTF